MYRVLPLEEVIIRVTYDKKNIIPEYGVGGFCGDEAYIDIFLEENRESDWERWLPSTLYHEWHHLARRRGPGYGKSLLEALISEGLALHFEIEVEGKEPPFFADFLEQDVRYKMIDILKIEYSDTQYDHWRWFFGKGEFPFLAGYDLSYYIIKKYLEDKGVNSSELVELSAKELSSLIVRL